MRGTRAGGPSPSHPFGIIPAYAGNTNSRTTRRVMHGDHPRVCGEHEICAHTARGHRGSSPRMRGTPSHKRKHPHSRRIIPAYAGNTLRFSRSISPYRDHPRVCGEHNVLEKGFFPVLGSSPRMRGTPFRITKINGQIGIIPAYAGNTHVLERTYSSCRDHPRVCGEHHGAAFDLNVNTGSSPRMRGTRPTRKDKGTRPGIIPAYAGNTF